MSDWRNESYEADNLPRHAWENTFDEDGPREIYDQWLKSAKPGEQYAAMKAWFLDRYEDPSSHTSYSSAEGGYLYTDGGPYEAGNVLFHRFGRLANEEVLNELVEELDAEGPEWASIPAPSFFDDDYTPFVTGSLEQNRDRFTRRLADLLAVLNLAGPVGGERAALHLVYSAVIGNLEAYLWETAVYLVRSDASLARQLVSKVPELAEQTMTMSKFLADYEKLPEMALSYLNRTVWHRWTTVSMIFSRGLGFKSLPSFQPLAKPTDIRNHIVHRSGRDLEGSPITVSRTTVDELVSEVSRIIDAIDQGAKAMTAKDRDDLDLPFY